MDLERVEEEKQHVAESVSKAKQYNITILFVLRALHSANDSWSASLIAL